MYLRKLSCRRYNENVIQLGNVIQFGNVIQLVNREARTSGFYDRNFDFPWERKNKAMTIKRMLS